MKEDFQELWGDKPYYDLNTYLRRAFGRKVYKLSLSGGMTCPNRDGTLGTRGCIFCSEGGSGDFAAPASYPISEQLRFAKDLVSAKLPPCSDTGYIAYFQSFTNTYAPPRFMTSLGMPGVPGTEYLRSLFAEALSDPEVLALAVGTRPDCIDDDIIALLADLNRTKPVWVELGLQTIHEQSAHFIRRGYPLNVFEACVARLKAAGLPVVVHLILGLPGESPAMMLDTVRYIARQRVFGVKLQLLHILSDTDLGRMFLEDPGFVSRLSIATPDDYISLLSDALRLLPPDTVIHRLTGDGPHERLLYPLWSANKRTTLNGLLRFMKEGGYRQGDLFE